MNGSAPPPGADEDAPPTAEVVLVVSRLVEVASDVVVLSEVLVAPELPVPWEVLVVVVSPGWWWWSGRGRSR